MVPSRRAAASLSLLAAQPVLRPQSRRPRHRPDSLRLPRTRPVRLAAKLPESTRVRAEPLDQGTDGNRRPRSVRVAGRDHGGRERAGGHPEPGAGGRKLAGPVGRHRRSLGGEGVIFHGRGDFFALGASLAALVAGAWFLPYQFPPSEFVAGASFEVGFNNSVSYVWYLAFLAVPAATAAVHGPRPV